MRPLLAAVLVLAPLSAVAAPAVQPPSLEASFSAVSAAVKAHPVVQTRQFYLESQGGRWRQWGGLPGDLMIDATQGQHVRIDLSLLPFGRQPFPEAMFDVDGLDAVVDGQPTKGIHVWMRFAPARAVVEFDALKPGVYPIYERWRGGWIGRIVIWKVKK